MTFAQENSDSMFVILKVHQSHSYGGVESTNLLDWDDVSY